VRKPSALTGVSFPAARIFGGLRTGLRLELDGPSPSGGAQIYLQSSNPQILPLFPEQLISAGANSISVPVTPNNPPTPLLIVVTADYRQRHLGVNVMIESLSLNVCNSLPDTLPGGSTINCTLTITNPGMNAPEGGIQFAVQTLNPTIVFPQATATIPAGENSTSLPITTRPVTQNTTVTLRLSAAGRTFNRIFTLTPQ
jgi:hypothetical protein